MFQGKTKSQGLSWTYHQQWHLWWLQQHHRNFAPHTCTVPPLDLLTLGSNSCFLDRPNVCYSNTRTLVVSVNLLWWCKSGLICLPLAWSGLVLIIRPLGELRKTKEHKNIVKLSRRKILNTLNFIFESSIRDEMFQRGAIEWAWLDTFVWHVWRSTYSVKM